MQRSTLILALGSLAGAPIMILPQARTTLGSNVFVGLGVLCLVCLMAGLGSWLWEHLNQE